LKQTLLKTLIPFGLYPHIRFTYSPFKILEFQALMDRVDFRGDERVLDIGCGDGLQTFLIGQQTGPITGIDLNTTFIEQARVYAAKLHPRAEADFLDQPLEAVGFPDDHFDLIFSVCVIEHIPNYEEVLRECYRTLKPGGRILFTVDTLETISDPDLVSKHRADHHVVQYFRPDTLHTLLEGMGFTDLDMETLFRSGLARTLFEEGIRKGFNFGRFRATRLAKKLAKAEAATPPDSPGIFLLATARKPA